MSYILTVLLVCVVSVPRLTAGHKGGKLTRLESRLDRMATRQEIDNLSRRDDVSDLNARLDDIQVLLNSSVTGPGGCQCSANGQASVEGGPKDTVADEIRVLQTAFAEEKARGHKDSSKMQNTIVEVQRQMYSELGNSVREVNHKMESALEKSAEELSLKMEIADETSAEELSLKMATAVEKSAEELSLKMETAIEKSAEELSLKMETAIEKSAEAVNLKMENAIDKTIEDVKSLIETSDKKALETVENMLENAIRAMKIDILDELKDAVKDILNNTEVKADGTISKVKKINTMEVKADDPISKVDKINITEVKETAVDPTPTVKEPASSCMALYKNGERQSGVYAVSPVPGKPSIQVYCDMETDGGGWTVFQRRQDGSVNFYRDWEEYASGFGDLDGEFWLGNTHVSDMTSECCHELRIELGDFEGNSAFAKYSSFKVLPENDNFRLEVGGYSGNASDSLAIVHNGREFSTKDRDNDDSYPHCAQRSKGAWWYNDCHYSNLNGEYLRGWHGSYDEGVAWYTCKGSGYSLKYTELMFRASAN